MKTIKTSNTNKDILVDDFNYERLYNLSKISPFCDTGSGIQLRTGMGSSCKINISLSKIIIQTDQEVVDHKDRDYLNFQIDNLRPCSRGQNNANKTVIYKSRFGRGVQRALGASGYSSRIKYKGKTIYLGFFNNPVDAALAYDKKAKELFGEFAVLNYPNENS